MGSQGETHREQLRENIRSRMRPGDEDSTGQEPGPSSPHVCWKKLLRPVSCPAALPHSVLPTPVKFITNVLLYKTCR